MRATLLIVAFGILSMIPVYAETTLAFEQVSDSQIVLHANAGGTLEVWVNNKLVLQEQLAGRKDYFFSAIAVIEAFLNKGSSSEITATWIGSNQIFFDPPFDQAVISGCDLKDNKVQTTGKAATKLLANVVVTATPVVTSVQQKPIAQGEPPTQFTGIALFQSPTALLTTDHDLGILISATMWSQEDIQLATRTAFVTPCQISLPLLIT